MISINLGVALLLMAPLAASAGQNPWTLEDHSGKLATRLSLLPSDPPIQVAVRIGDEDREKFEDFASPEYPLDELSRAFAASGTISCWGEGSAQIVGNNDVMVTAAHVLFDDQCRQKDVTLCFFFRPDAPDVKYFLDGAVIRSGKEAGGCYQENRYFDWAVAKLGEPVRGVVPYAVPNSDPLQNIGDRVVMVSSGDMNFAPGGLNIQTCAIQGLWFYDNVPIQTDCDTGDKSSGAGQFALQDGILSLDSKKLVLTSINVAEKGAQDGLPFQNKGQYNTSVPVETDFLAAIKALAGE